MYTTVQIKARGSKDGSCGPDRAPSWWCVERVIQDCVPVVEQAEALALAAGLWVQWQNASADVSDEVRDNLRPGGYIGPLQIGARTWPALTYLDLGRITAPELVHALAEHVAAELKRKEHRAHDLEKQVERLGRHAQEAKELRAAIEQLKRQVEQLEEQLHALQHAAHEAIHEKAELLARIDQAEQALQHGEAAVTAREQQLLEQLSALEAKHERMMHEMGRKIAAAYQCATSAEQERREAQQRAEQAEKDRDNDRVKQRETESQLRAVESQLRALESQPVKPPPHLPPGANKKFAYAAASGIKERPAHDSLNSSEKTVRIPSVAFTWMDPGREPQKEPGRVHNKPPLGWWRHHKPSKGWGQRLRSYAWGAFIALTGVGIPTLMIVDISGPLTLDYRSGDRPHIRNNLDAGVPNQGRKATRKKAMTWNLTGVPAKQSIATQLEAGLLSVESGRLLDGDVLLPNTEACPAAAVSWIFHINQHLVASGTLTAAQPRNPLKIKTTGDLADVRFAATRIDNTRCDVQLRWDQRFTKTEADAEPGTGGTGIRSGSVPGGGRGM